MHLILLGFMGAGKSTLGQAAAYELGWPFLDLDELIEAQQKRSIRAIFEEKGETYFRKLEASAIAFMAGLETPHLIATGGGTPCHGDNMQRLNEAGTTIYLKPNTETLIARLESMRAERPMLSEIPADKLSGFIHALLAQREPYYRKAHHILDEAHLTTKSIVALAT